jgi:multiple sugar transport system ATP-binding protein
MAQIELIQVEKKFGDFQAVKPLDLTIEDGEFVVLLGPSGCGKTTTLRMISGLESVTGGQIMLDGENVTWHAPSERDIAFVFQLYALYPHLTARQNIAFPLQAQGQKKDVIDKRVDEVVKFLRIQQLLDQRPGNLSGGDQQRIALARALVRKPKAFLMDEPLGALDADFREVMRAEIKRVHIAENATTVYVTHDQVEAMAMGDRIVVMSNAEIQQVGTPHEVYYNPANLFVAKFIGSPGMNLVSGVFADGVITAPGENNKLEPPQMIKQALTESLDEKGELLFGFRPEAAEVKEDGALKGEVYAVDMHGAYSMLHINLNEMDLVHVRTPRAIEYTHGDKVAFDLDLDYVRYFDNQSEKAIMQEVVQ